MSKICFSLSGGTCISTNYQQFANKDYIQAIYNFTCEDNVNYNKLSGCFENCLSLTSFTFKSDCKMVKIPKRFFKNCTSLKSITLPSTIEEIDESAFEGCDNLTTITHSGNLKYVNDKAFKGCVNLDVTNLLKPKVKAISQDNTTLVIASEAYARNSLLESIDFTTKELSGITAIENGAFANCEKLSGITFYNKEIPSSASALMYIGETAFLDTVINEVKLPDKIIQIGTKAFAECNELSAVTKLNHEFPMSINSNAFLNCAKLNTLNITGSSVTTERFLYLGDLLDIPTEADKNKKYGDIIELNDTMEESIQKQIKRNSLSSKGIDYINSNAFIGVNKSGTLHYDIKNTDNTFKEIHEKRKKVFTKPLPKNWTK